MVLSIFVLIGAFLIFFYLRGDTNYKSINVNGKTMRAHVKGSGDKTIVMLSGWGIDSPIDDFFPFIRKTC